MPYANPETRKAAGQAWYLRNRESQLGRTAQRRASLSVEVKRRYQKNARARYAALGLTSAGKHRKVRTTALSATRAEREAKQAWKHWLSIAPDSWMAAYYDAGAKPWRNPRLSSTTAHAMRYRLDAEFHQRELERLKAKKRRHREEIASAVSDLERGQYITMRSAATACGYCGCTFTVSNRSMDHFVPLSRGGDHTRSNLVPACTSCNSRKQDRLLPRPPVGGFKVLPEI